MSRRPLDRCNQCHGKLPAAYRKRNCESCLSKRRKGGVAGVKDHRWCLRTKGEIRVHLTVVSGNTKTGPIPVSRTSPETCPPSCPLYNAGCYGENPRQRMHWRRVHESGAEWPTFLERVRALPEGQLWRHNEVGDLPGQGECLSVPKLLELVDANAGRRGFTMTHKHRSVAHREAIRLANEGGFTINLSADNIPEADRLKAHGVGPVVVVLRKDESRKYFETGRGNRVVVCPAARGENVQCSDCGLCQVSNRKCIVGFPAHGHQHRKVSERVGVAHA